MATIRERATLGQSRALVRFSYAKLSVTYPLQKFLDFPPDLLYLASRLKVTSHRTREVEMPRKVEEMHRELAGRIAEVIPDEALAEQIADHVMISAPVNVKRLAKVIGEILPRGLAVEVAEALMGTARDDDGDEFGPVWSGRGAEA